MERRIKISVEGKIQSIIEDTIIGGGGFSPRRELKITLVVDNALLNMQQKIDFLRPEREGEILSTFINDFKEHKKIEIKGYISYYLGNPYNLRVPFLFRDSGETPFFKQLCNSLKLLPEKTDWTKVIGSDKEYLRKFLELVNAPFAGEINLAFTVDGTNKYMVYSNETRMNSAIISLQ